MAFIDLSAQTTADLLGLLTYSNDLTSFFGIPEERVEAIKKEIATEIIRRRVSKHIGADPESIVRQYLGRGTRPPIPKARRKPTENIVKDYLGKKKKRIKRK